MRKGIVSYAVFVLSGFLASNGWGNIIYDVDFENPPHVADTQVVTGSGSDRPQFADTSVIIRNSPADFTTQAASLEPAGAMTFSPGVTFSDGIAFISWDLAVTDVGSGGPAAVSLGSDAGLSIIVFYRADLSIDVTLGGLNPIDVGSYTLGQHDSYAFSVDLDNEFYDFSLNGSPIINDEPLSSGWDLINVSFGRENLADPTYAVDNFQWQVIPEPSSLILMLLSGLALTLRRLRRKV